jgi:hypothetical protein
MKKIIINCLAGLLVCIAGYSQLPYSLSSVPEALKKKANIITHLSDMNLEVESIDKVSMNVHEIFTVVNEEGKRALIFGQQTSKSVSLDEVEIRVYDGNGKQMGKYKKKDMATTIMGEGLIEDGQVTIFRIPASGYPVTVDLKYELKLKNTLSIPSFRFIGLNEGVVEANYTIKIAEEMGLRYKPKNTSIEPAITTEDKYKVYKWTVKNLPPIDYEEGSVAVESRYPHVTIAPNHFSYYGLEGDLSSWKSFGAWINNLYKDLDVLPEDRRQFFSRMVKDIPDEKGKIRRIYNYMQDNFRYVSIQLGIGGLKPFPADFTDKKKYGDCKSLSNYMKAALKAVGIKSYVAIINAEYDQEPVDPDFPCNNFDHVILCVPGQKDSVWLECTSSTAEFNELGTFTENRNALLVTEEGGVLVPTPKSNSSSNVLSTITTVQLSDDLSALVNTKFTTKGAYRQTIGQILKEKKDEQKEAIVFYFGFKQPDDFELSKDDKDPGNAKLVMVIAKVPGFTSGSKLFISPRFYRMWPGSLPKADERKLDFYFRYPFEKSDTTILKLPPGIKPDVLPKENELHCDYAVYKTKYWYNDSENSIYTATSLVLKQHKIPASAYASVKKFFDDVIQDDSQKMVVQKNNATEKKAF